VARAKEFDPEALLGAAMGCSGGAATSTADVEHLGIGR
jgi:hypothetical protein